MANNTETVTRLSQLAKETRVKAKELDPAGPSLRVGETSILVGDEVVTRRNDRTLRTDRGLMVNNRDHWTITCIHRDRSVSITGRTGVVHPPAGHVTEHLELGYAQTSHATQGRTVDVGLFLVDSPIDSRGCLHADDPRPRSQSRLCRHRKQPNQPRGTHPRPGSRLDRPARGRSSDRARPRSTTAGQATSLVKPTRSMNSCDAPSDVSQNARNERN